MNLPNKLTVFRMFMVPVFCSCSACFTVFRYRAQNNYRRVFAVVSLTDMIDGKIARKVQHDNPDFGKFMDPLAG